MSSITTVPTCAARIAALVSSLALWMCLLTGLVRAQVSPDEHASHHPEQQGPGPSPGQGPGNAGGADAGGMQGGMGGGMGGMGEMMSKMGVPPPKELYPSLMDLPDLPPEARAEVQAKAHERMKTGVARLSLGLDGLVGAAPGDDWQAMQSAVLAMRDGLAEFESGLAAHQALSEGRAPRSVAMQWFKGQMNLLPPLPAPGLSGPFGFGWFHLSSMVLLVAFAVVMMWMYFHKMRRAAELLENLASPGSNAAPAVVPPSSGAATSTSPPQADGQPHPVATAKSEKWSGKLRLCRVFEETPSIKTYRLLAEDGSDVPFRFKPGQFLTLSIAQGEKTIKRAYTIASAPTVRGYVEITVKREQHGVVSKHLHDNVTEGALLDVSAPMGKFTFTGKEAPSIVLIGGGVGVTPLMSVVRYLTDTGWDGQITLLFVCRDRSEFLYRNELEALQRRHAKLTVVVTMSREKGKAWKGARGRLTKKLIAESVADITSQRIHICGPGPMMTSVKEALGELGVPAANIKSEAFGSGTAKPSASVDAPAEVKSTTVTPATASFSRSKKAGPIGVEQTILDVADAVGVDIDNSCRSGTCGSCKVKLLEGQVTMELEDSLEPDEKAEGLVLACQAKSKANVVVDA